MNKKQRINFLQSQIYFFERVLEKALLHDETHANYHIKIGCKEIIEEYSKELERIKQTIAN